MSSTGIWVSTASARTIKTAFFLILKITRWTRARSAPVHVWAAVSTRRNQTNLPMKTDRRKTFVVYDRRDGGSDRSHEIRSGPQCRQHKTLRTSWILSYRCKEKWKKIPWPPPRPLAGMRVVVYCNSFYFLFLTAHVRDIKIPNRRRVEIERRVSKIDVLGCIRTPSGIDHIYIYIYNTLHTHACIIPCQPVAYI